MLYTAISGLYFWAEAQKEAYANNDPVGSITDWSVRGNTLTQGTGGAQPTFLASEVNDKAAFSFDGGDYLVKTSATGIGHSAFTFFAVVKRTGTGSRRTLWYAGDSTNGGRQIVIDTSEKLRLTKSQVAEITPSSASVSNSAYELWELTYDGGTWFFYVNGVLDSTGTASQSFVDTVPVIYLGTNTGALPTEPYNSTVALVLAYDSVLSENDRIRVENQVATDYGLFALSLTTTTLYMTDNYAPGSLHGALQVGGDLAFPGAVATRWVVGNLNPASLKYARMKFNYKTPSMANFGFSPQPSSEPQSAASVPGDCYRTGKYRGDVAASDWVFVLPVKAVTTGGSQDGRFRCRIWKSGDPTGAGAEELTSGAEVSSTATNLSTTILQYLTLTITLPAFTLDYEYLFFQYAWEITGQGASATCDVALMSGGDAKIYTPPLPLEIPGFYALFYPDANFRQPGEYIDISHRLLAYHSTRGRADALSGIEAGTLQADFDDDDAALDPKNTASPYYPDVKLRRGLQVVAQYGGISYPRGTVAIDTYAGEPLVLGADASIAGSDLYKRLLQAEVTATYSAGTDGLRIQELMESQFISGTVITAEGDFLVPSASLVKAKILDHIDLIVKAGRGQFWIGADGIPRYWGRHERLNQTSVGTFGAGGDYQIPTPQPVLDDAGLYNRINVRRTASGVNEVQQITITGSPTDGAFTVGYEGAESYAIGHDSDITFIQTALEAMSTIGPGNVVVSSSSSGFPAFPTIVTFIGDLGFRNLAQMTIVQQSFLGGTSPSVAVSTVTNGVDPTQTTDDSASQSAYGVIPFDLDQAAADLLANDEEAMNWGAWFAYQHAQPTSEFRIITIDPWADPANLWPIVLSADIGTVLTLTHDIPGSKGTIGENYYIEGFDESGTLQGDPDFTFQWKVSKAEADFGHFWVLDETDELETDTTIVF